MNVNRPRESILDLFDPLNSTSPSTPRRDVTSPDSDKENSQPPSHPVNELTMTAYFNRTCKESHPELVVLKRRLIDIGDATMDDSSVRMSQDEEDEVVVNDGEDDTLTLCRLPAVTQARSLGDIIEPITPSSSSPRTPFAEMALERVIAPVVRSKVYRREVLGPSSLYTCHSVTPAPEDSTLASVINAVNFSGISFADSSSTMPSTKANNKTTHEEDGRAVSNNEYAEVNELVAPEIAISLPDTLSNSMSTLHLATSTGTPLTSTTIPLLIGPPSPCSSQEKPLDPSSHLAPPRLRPSPPNTSSHDPRRNSVDLCFSFNLQLQSTETTFDLLNDKISFCGGSGMDSLLNDMGEDNSFDMEVEEANMERALERIGGEEEENKENAVQCSPTVTKHECTKIVPESKPQVAVSSTPTPCSTTTPQGSEEKTVRKCFSKGSGSGSPMSPTFDFGQSKANAKMLSSPSVRALPKASSSDTRQTIGTRTFAPHTTVPTTSIFLHPSTKTSSNSALTVASSSSSSTVVPTALPVHVAPVAALKIVKRTKKFTKARLTSTARVPNDQELMRSEPSPGISGSSSSIDISRIQRSISVPSLAPIPVSISETGLSTSRQPAATNSAAASYSQPRSRMAVPLSSASASSAASKTNLFNRFGPGPRRVPIAENQVNLGVKAGSGVGMANGRLGMQRSGSVIAGMSVGARRVVAGNTHVQGSSNGPVTGMGVVSGLKPLARYGNETGGSALSRPFSRLPAPVSGRSGGAMMGTRTRNGQSNGGIPVLRRAYGQ